MFAFISWCVFGLIIGIIVRFLVPGRDPMPIWGTILLGMVGSIVGGGIAQLLWGNVGGRVHAAGWIMSIIGGVVTLLLWRKFGSRAM